MYQPDFLAAKVIEEVVSRANIDKSAVGEVILGQTKQSSDAAKYCPACRSPCRTSS